MENMILLQNITQRMKDFGTQLKYFTIKGFQSYHIYKY